MAGTSATRTSEDQQAATTVNEVHLVGRLAAPAEERTLPSGEILVLWRLVVDRPPTAVPEGVRPQTVDTLECVARKASVRRPALGWEAGDVIDVEGALRRRFWRAPHGVASRYEVEVAKARRVTRRA